MERLTFRVLDPPMDTHGHSHPRAQILLPLTRELRVVYNEVEHHVTSQDLCFIPPMCFHYCYCPAEVITMDIPPNMLHPSDLTALERQTVYHIEGDLVPLADLIKSEVKKNPSSISTCYLYYFLYNKLVLMNECASLRYIREHYNEYISIETLAQLENYTPSYFTEWFRQKNSYSPSIYLKRFRVEKAKELLINNQYSLLDVALQVGYNSHSAFTRAFKDIEGCSPQEYRKTIMKSPLI